MLQLIGRDLVLLAFVSNVATELNPHKHSKSLAEDAANWLAGYDEGRVEI